MTADLTPQQEYRRELEDALATLREAGDLGQYTNTPITGLGSSAKLRSVAGAAIFVASHIWALAYRDRLGESPLYAFRAGSETQRLGHTEDLPLTMASPSPSAFVPAPSPMATTTQMVPDNYRDYMKDLRAKMDASPLEHAARAKAAYGESQTAADEQQDRFAAAIKKGSGL